MGVPNPSGWLRQELAGERGGDPRLLQLLLLLQLLPSLLEVRVDDGLRLLTSQDLLEDCAEIHGGLVSSHVQLGVLFDRRMHHCCSRRCLCSRFRRWLRLLLLCGRGCGLLFYCELDLRLGDGAGGSSHR